MGARDRELHALVLADRPAEHDALLGVLGGAADEVAAHRPAHSEAIRMRSAFMLSTMYLKPWPSSPIRFSAGTSRLSKNTSQVLWLIMASIFLISTPLPLASRRSTRNTDRPSERFLTLSGGVVRASSSIRSECMHAAESTPSGR